MPGGRYGLVLASLVTSYLVTAFLSGRLAGLLSALLYAFTLLLALRTSGLHQTASRALRLGLALGTIAAVVLLIISTDVTNGLADLWFALLLLVAISIVVRRVLSDQVVTIQTLLGAFSAYLMIGLMFAGFYGALAHFMTGPLFAHNQPVTTNTLQYFSFTTLTTLGYGDFTAAGNAARAVATLEAVMGQIFLATLVARLVASFTPGHGRSGAGSGPSIVESNSDEPTPHSH